MQDSNGNLMRQCGLCECRDEEDMILITMLLLRADPTINDWVFSRFEDKDGRNYGPRRDQIQEEGSISRNLREIFRLGNFRKLVVDLLSHKYPDVSTCSHSDYHV